MYWVKIKNKTLAVYLYNTCLFSHVLSLGVHVHGAYRGILDARHFSAPAELPIACHASNGSMWLCSYTHQCLCGGKCIVVEALFFSVGVGGCIYLLQGSLHTWIATFVYCVKTFGNSFSFKETFFPYFSLFSFCWLCCTYLIINIKIPTILSFGSPLQVMAHIAVFSRFPAG